MKKIYVHSHASALDFIFLEPNVWSFVSEVEDAEFVVSVWENNLEQQLKTIPVRKDQILLLITIDETAVNPNLEFYPVFAELLKHHEKTLFIHNNLLSDLEGIKDDHFLCGNLFFNRHVYCFVDQRITKDGYKWSINNIPNSVFKLESMKKESYLDNKLFLCLNRLPYKHQPISNLHDEYKAKFKKFFIKNSDVWARTYLGDPGRGKPLLYGDCDMTDQMASEKIVSGTFAPASNKYYRTSYVSIYIESNPNLHGNFDPCEKTYNPLIQGNFILPFARPNFIKLCKEYYGFKFPTWIDYSYETIMDDEKRFQAYVDVITQLNKFSLKQIHEFYLNDFHMLDHNRNIFLQRKYNKTYEKIHQAIQKLGW